MKKNKLKYAKEVTDSTNSDTLDDAKDATVIQTKENKKNKVWNTADIKKSRRYLLLLNLVIYISLLAVFIVTVYFFSRTMFKNQTKDIILDYENDIKIIANDPRNYIGESNIDDPRITAVYYYTDPKFVSQEQFLSPVITGSIIKGSLGREDVTPIDQIKNEKMNSFAYEDVLGFHFKTYVTNVRYRAVESPSIKRDRTVCYVKIYLNIDGERLASRTFNTVISVGFAILLILFIGAAFTTTNYSLKKAQISVQKQLDFTSDASHELRTPISVVSTKLELTLTRPNNTIMQESEDIAVSLSELYRISKLVKDLLELSRMDQSRVDYTIKNYNMNDLIKETVSNIEDIAIIKGCPLSYSGVDCYCNVDRDKIKELMVILIDNAVKYSNSGEAIDVTVNKVRGSVEICVSDHGKGIKDEAKPKVFDRFFREDSVRTKSDLQNGTGLGLSIAKSIVNDLGGKISVEDNYENDMPKGTKFKIVLKSVKHK